MKFGLFTYKNRNNSFNVGDHIQSLAAKQYLPQVDKLIERDSLSLLKLEDKIAVIMNGWFTHHPENWPPVPNIVPLFVSFHLNSAHAAKVLNKEENVKYFKKHSPIGCRDTGTVKFLKERGIDAFYSSCLTTTLDKKYKSNERGEDIYMVDVLYKDDMFSQYKASPRRILSDIKSGRILKLFKRGRQIKNIFPKSILAKAQYITHSYRNDDYNEAERFALAEDLLKKYARAKLVITSRIHCALPCLAMGTPVLFITGGGLFNKSEMSRLQGIIEHLNVVSTEPLVLDKSIATVARTLDPKTIDWDNITNPSSHTSYAEKLKSTCETFITNLR
ncbi:polysaccharide pyruvyl transferase family protein [Sphingobacterium griseoflavum]|uniref:Polysaccharide pyruvyl transferase domain-containing protein n=1 Tax=Sphingobacterium griseoflavum TaxID=1474952 RepID=A0ABQ3HZJ9_9SPHI|nr:polysaccharide pyruvyl transferase family protein [Sphingobacterium griseoflavum]GHE38915.1 hypothetical protein GCM10017764_22600 [Sphingobacterium griseoflavum]